MTQEVDILLIEDDIYDAELAIRALNKSHLPGRLVHLQNGSDASDFVFCEGNFSKRNSVNIPKVILLDLKMPKVDGTEVLKKFKSDERSKNIPVVILTSSKEAFDIKNCYRLGANSYVVKPVEFNDFVKVLRALGSYWLDLNQAAL